MGLSMRFDKKIRKMRFPRDPICIYLTYLTLSNEYSNSYLIFENDFNGSPFNLIDKFEPFKIRINHIILNGSNFDSPVISLFDSLVA